jgi:hypothetical protein
VFVPVEEVFPGTEANERTLLDLLGTLSRDDTLFQCARINTTVSGQGVPDVKLRQQQVLQGFCTPEQISRINDFAIRHAGGPALKVPEGASKEMPLSGKTGGSRRLIATGLVCSSVLHGLLLAALLPIRSMSVATHVIPVDVVPVNEDTAGPLQPEAAMGLPQKAAAAPQSQDSPPPSIPSPNQPTDPLEQKLERLAKLQETDEHRPLPKSDVRSLHVSPASSDVEAPEVTYAVSDFIRAQVERRWGLDVGALGGRALSVLVRVEITNTGVVTKAEIVRNAQLASDKAYRDAALSARNAVVLSSPFTLPAGHYNSRMAFTLRLDTQDALR